MIIELKIGEFKPADFGQVELCLRWLDRHERQSGEAAPMAIILHQARAGGLSHVRQGGRREGEDGFGLKRDPFHPTP